MISGGNKGKKGKVVKSIPSTGKVVIEGVNVKKKHVKARRSGEKGQIIEIALPINASNVKLA